MFEKFKVWCGSNTPAAKCTRTIFQGALGVIISFAPDMVAGTTVIPAEMKPFTTALVMAVLAPIQAALGASLEEAE